MRGHVCQLCPTEDYWQSSEDYSEDYWQSSEDYSEEEAAQNLLEASLEIPPGATQEQRLEAALIGWTGRISTTNSRPVAVTNYC